MPLLTELRAFSLVAAATFAPFEPPPDDAVVGPMVGHVDHESAVLWIRAADEGRYQILLRSEDRLTPGGPKAARILGNVERYHAAEVEATAERDLCVEWIVDDLEPSTEYTYEVRRDGERVAGGGRRHRFRTAPAPGTPARVKLAFGSCASSEPSPVWSAIELDGADGVVLLGDTPYIDTTDLANARAKHRRFLQIPELARLALSTPVWGTWDDHDFGKNDSDGRLEGKENTRRAFVEYRAHLWDGDPLSNEGVYTSFRRGPIEVFLLDTRYFARTEPASEGSDLPTLLGNSQWAWLQKGLLFSKAPFKVIACGMIWDDKENTESDDWGSYPHERERLERFLGEEKISGAVLVGGDIHVSRHLRYPETKERVGYVLDQLIVSPLHDGVIESLDVPHPALLWSAKEPHVFMTLEANTLGEAPTLEARWVQDVGRGAGRVLRSVRWTLDDLRQE